MIGEDLEAQSLVVAAHEEEVDDSLRINDDEGIAEAPLVLLLLVRLARLVAIDEARALSACKRS